MIINLLVVITILLSAVQFVHWVLQGKKNDKLREQINQLKDK